MSFAGLAVIAVVLVALVAVVYWLMSERER